MEGRDTPNNLLSFAEDSSVQGEHSRASSQRHTQPRLQSASSKGRNAPSVKNFYDGASSRLKSSFVTLKNMKKARLEEREDNLPTLEFDQVKWIPIIKAYDPTRLKNITVKKKSFEEFFGKHNPNQDPLGQLYIQSVLDHFRQWQAKLNRRYGRILDQFLGSGEALNCEEIEAELDSIEKNTHDLKDILSSILHKYENHRIRRLIEGFQRSLEKASEIMAIINIIYESKRKMEDVLQKLEGKKQLKRILKNLRDKEIEQTREVFRNHPPNKFEDEIVERVSQAITSMANMTVEAVDQLESMKHIVERIQRILQNREQTMGLKGLDQINQVFEAVLDEARVFQESSSRIHENNFFNDEFKKKVAFYEKEMHNKKRLIVEYIFSMVDSILAGMVQTFQQYQSLVEPLQRQPENFGALKTGLRNIAKNLVKEQLPQGKQLLQFIEGVSKNLETLKGNSQELQELKKVFAEAHFDDDYVRLLKRLGTFSSGYKHNIKELIGKFARMRSELHKREGSQIQRLDTQPKEDTGPDLESEYIEKLHKLCMFFDKNRLEELGVFEASPLDIFKNGDIAAASSEISAAQKFLQRVHSSYADLKNLLRNNEIRDITGQVRIRSRLLVNFDLLEKLFEEAALVRQDTFHDKLPICRQLLIQLINCGASAQPAYIKLILCRLHSMLSPQNLPAAIGNLSRSIEDGKDCVEQVKLYTQQETFVRDVQSCLVVPEDIQLIEQLNHVIGEYEHLLSIHSIKIRLDRKDNMFFPNTEFIGAIVREQFSWLFVLRHESLSKLNSFMGNKRKILKRQNELLHELQQTRTYREVAIIKKQIDGLLEAVQSFTEAVSNITGLIDREVAKDVISQYPTFLNSCLAYLTSTRQLFFCLLTRKNQPLYLSVRQENDSSEVVANFLTCVGLPADKQWIGRLKSDWKEESYKIPVKQEKENTTEKKKDKANGNVNRSPRQKATDEPCELIEVEPGDEIIDDFDLEEKMEEDIADEAIEEDNMDDEVGEQINDVAAEEDIQVEEENIPAEEVAEEAMEEDIMGSQPSQDTTRKRLTPQRVSRPESASPKRVEREKTEPLEKMLKRKEELRRHLKPLFVKLTKVESIEALLESLRGFDTFSEFHRGLVQPLVFQQLLNQLFVEMVAQKNPKPDAVALLRPCRQNCKQVTKAVQEYLKNNLLKDFICMEPQYRRLTGVLRELEERLSGDLPSELTLYKVGKFLTELLSALGLPFRSILKSPEQIGYVSQQPSICSDFISDCLKLFEVKFTKAEQENIEKAHLSKANKESGELAEQVFVITDLPSLNAADNNRCYRELQQLLTFSDYSKPYDLSQIHKVFEGIWLGSKSHATMILDEVRKKNAAKIDPVVNQHQASLNHFSSQLNKELKAYKQRISNLENKLAEGETVSQCIQHLLESELMRGRTFKLCSDGTDYIMLSEAQPQPIVRRLAGLICGAPESRFLRYVEPTKVEENVYTYSLDRILAAIVNDLDNSEKKELPKWAQFYGNLNAQMFNGKNDQSPALKNEIALHSAELEELIGLERLNWQRLNAFTTKLKQRLDLKKRELQFLADVGVVDTWDKYNKLADRLLDKKLVLSCPATIIYCNDTLYRIYPRSDLDDVERQLGKLLYDDSTVHIKLSEERRSNGCVIASMPTHFVKFYSSEPMDRVNKYLGSDLTLKIECAGKTVYEGLLQEIVEIKYEFPQMKNIDVRLSKAGQEICCDTIPNLRPCERLISDELNDKVKKLVQRKIREAEEERLRLEEERRERERKQFEERQRVRLEKEREELAKKEEEERLKREEEDRMRQEEERRIRKEKEQEQRKQKEKQEEARQAELQKLRSTKERFDKQSLLAKPKTERKKAAEKSRQIALMDSNFVEESKQLQSKDITLKTPEEVIDERSEDNPSELGVEEEYEDSITPSEGFKHEDIVAAGLKPINFEEIFHKKGAEDKFKRFQSRLNSLPNGDS